MWKIRDIFLIAFFYSFAITPLLRYLAFKFDILDHPKQHGIHQHPVPRLGGLALYMAFVLGSLYRMDLSEELKGVLVGSSIVFVIGLIDDIFHLRASLKLFVQILACGIMMFKYGVILSVFPNAWLNGFFTALGIIGITNAVNFLDNMDGLASGLVIISSVAIAYVAHITGQIWLGYLSVALAGACAGFIIFNMRGAYIFMGDAGSTFLGYTLASLCVMTNWSEHTTITIAAPILILGVPILDMILITVLRIKENKVRTVKQWIDYTGKDHLSHRVARLGVGKFGAVFALWIVQGIFCLVAISILQYGTVIGLIGIFFYLEVTGGTIYFFRRRRRIMLKMSGRRRIIRRPVKQATR